MGLDWVAPGAETLYGTVQRDMQLLTQSSVQNRLRYEVISYMRGQNMSLKPLERALYTQLPQTLNPEVQQLATQWRNQTSDADAIVKQAMQYFRSQGFTYTLQPPLLGSDPVAEFLFKTKRGFCEHYAAAMTTLLRASNVPARVVTGYLGGEINPLDGTLVVRQSDAHAWVEAWSDTHGWFRVDPTAVVAPERLENSLTNRVASSDGSLRFNIDAGWLRSVWRQTSFGWDAVNNAWHQWVMGYTQKRQQNLLADWGIDNRRWQQLSLVLLGGIGLVGAGMTLWIMRRQARRYDPVTTLYHGYCHRLARCGLLRLSHEGPWDYCQRVCTQRPELAAYVRRVTRLYLPLRYGTDPVTRADLSELRLAIRQPLPKLKHSDQVPTRVLGVVQRSIGAGDQGVN
jgi:transglutaminase-like putative cysteine protease